MFMPRVRVYLALRYTYTPHRRREKNFLRDGMGYSVLMEEDGSYLHLVDFSKQFKLKVLDDTKSDTNSATHLARSLTTRTRIHVDIHRTPAFRTVSPSWRDYHVSSSMPSPVLESVYSKPAPHVLETFYLAIVLFLCMLESPLAGTPWPQLSLTKR
ncbi:hypothetical protein RRG08_039974 [Elysia crispata]|uniref:Uncharacterized protein n=1 Tax=Elysia crispata TaxID=231223 RepID=A0AAE0Z7P9_9GAST|nr:hypothetical protein RRG08_039974 [Elysia crispata]